MLETHVFLNDSIDVRENGKSKIDTRKKAYEDVLRNKLLQRM